MSQIKGPANVQRAYSGTGLLCARLRLCGLGTGMPYRPGPASVHSLHFASRSPKKITRTWRATSSARPTLDLRHATDFTDSNLILLPASLLLTDCRGCSGKVMLNQLSHIIFKFALDPLEGALGRRSHRCAAAPVPSIQILGAIR